MGHILEPHIKSLHLMCIPGMKASYFEGLVSFVEPITLFSYASFIFFALKSHWFEMPAIHAISFKSHNDL